MSDFGSGIRFVSGVMHWAWGVLSQSSWVDLYRICFISCLLRTGRESVGEGNGTPHQYSCPENPWTEEPGRLQPMRSLRVWHDWATSLSLSLSCIGEGNGNPFQRFCLENLRDGGAWWLPSMGSHRVGHDWSDLAAAAANNDIYDRKILNSELN